MSADNQQGRTQYRVEYDIEGAEYADSISQTFRASSDSEASERARGMVKKAQDRCNGQIENPFWHYRYIQTGLFRIEQEEISHSIE